MEDLWKLTRIDYCIPALDEQVAYEEIVRRYHNEDVGSESSSVLNKDVPRPKVRQE